MGKPSKDYAVPLWEKANLTVYEAAAYSGIGAEMILLYGAGGEPGRGEIPMTRFRKL